MALVSISIILAVACSGDDRGDLLQRLSQLPGDKFHSHDPLKPSGGDLASEQQFLRKLTVKTLSPLNLAFYWYQSKDLKWIDRDEA